LSTFWAKHGADREQYQ